MADWDKSARPPPPNPAVVFLQVGLGMSLVFIGHLVFIGLLVLAAALGSGVQRFSEAATMLGIYGTLGLSCAQVIYVLPLLVAGLLIRRPIALGVIIGATLTVLLQGGCYGVVALLATTVH